MGGVEIGGSFLLHKPFFKEFHLGCIIKSPIIITPQYVSLGKGVYIGYHARIEGVDFWNGQSFVPSIKLCEGASVQQNLHLTCAKSVVIGKNTAIAANVTITDIHHPYSDVTEPIEHQMIEVREVEIGDDCKIYNNVVILPGVHIGKHVTIGANSVVSHSIPDFCVAVGNPAKIIKKYSFEQQQWIKTDG